MQLHIRQTETTTLVPTSPQPDCKVPATQQSKIAFGYHHRSVMATLSQLPNETITEIWGHISEPRDLESFAMVSKQIYAKCGPLVKEHIKLKREYSVFETGPNTRASAPAILLKEVLLRPRLALYVTHLSIGRYEVQWQDPDHHGDDDIPYSKEWPETRHTPYPDEDMALFIEEIRKAVLGPKEVRHWITSVRAGDEDPILALLSLVLTRLTRITLKSFRRDRGDLFLKAIEHIARAEHGRGSTRLATVDLHIPSRTSDKESDEESDEESEYEWCWLKRLATLSTVQSLYVKGVGILENDDVPTGEQFFIPGTSDITEVTFVESGVGPKMMFGFLESIKGLKRFSYVKPHEDAFHEFEPFWMRAALLTNAKHSLEYLNIACSEVDERKLLGDFRGFTALRELETNVEHLIPRTGSVELADILPASIEELYLHTTEDGEDGTHTIVPLLVEIFRQAKSRHLGNLRVLMLSSVYEFGATQAGMHCLEALVVMCRDVGIELTVVTQCSPAKEQVAVPGSILNSQRALGRSRRTKGRP